MHAEIPSFLDTAHAYLSQSVAPMANEIDSDPDALCQVLKGFGDLGLLALRVPRRWGGREVQEQEFDCFQKMVARYSGALAFLATQHQSATSMLAASSNVSLQQEYLPRINNGQVFLGTGFSQIRREGEPLIMATPVAGGYHLDGIVPWVTGWSFFSEFIVAATLPDNRAVFGLVPFQETHQKSGGWIKLTPPAQLAAMTSTQTVSATFMHLFVPEERVVFIKPPGWIHDRDQKNVLRASFLAMGCSLAGLDIIESTISKKPRLEPFLTHAFESLQRELEHCHTAIQKAQQHPHGEFAERLQLRAWSIDLAVRIAHAAVTASGGTANYSHHSAQRVYREALVYTVTGQTPAVMEAILARLTRA